MLGVFNVAMGRTPTNKSKAEVSPPQYKYHECNLVNNSSKV